MQTRIVKLQQRRGMTSVLAMLYLVLFGTLAIGFYSATNVQTQVAANDEHVARAFMSAESGMDFMRYQLGRVTVPPETPLDQVIDQLYIDLQAQLEDTGNLGTMTLEHSGNTIQIPANNEKIPLHTDGNSTFRATITDWAGEIVVKIEGFHGTASATRAITMDFSRAQHPTSAFDYAVASKGQIVMKKGLVSSVTGVDPSIATMMSALAGDPAINVTGGTIGGDLSVTENGTVQVSGGSVGGASDANTIMDEHVHVVDEPEFPTIDTTVYKPYATNVYADGAPLVNVRIPPNTNKKFLGNTTIQGILYVESPNQLEFQGNVTLQGFIVFEPGAGTTDKLTFTGNLTMSPLPNQPQFDPLRAVSGVAILAPQTDLEMTGSSSANLKGNIIVETFLKRGGDWVNIDQGTLMTYGVVNNACVFDTSKGLRFTATGSNNMPTAGLTYSSYYQPNAASYQEVAP